MNPKDFCYWLQGYFEISKSNKVNEEATLLIKKHLALVFKNESKSLLEENEIKEKRSGGSELLNSC